MMSGLLHVLYLILIITVLAIIVFQVTDSLLHRGSRREMFMNEDDGDDGIEEHFEQVLHRSSGGSNTRKCIVLNMDRRTVNLADITRAIQASDLVLNNWQVQRVSAVDPSMVTRDQLARFLSPSAKEDAEAIPDAVIATVLSHVSVLQMLLEDEEQPYYLVFEDNTVSIPFDIHHRVLGPLLERDPLGAHWDIILLGYHAVNQASLETPPALSLPNILMPGMITSFSGTHAYLVSKTAALRITRAFEDNRIEMPYNSQVGHMGLRIYATTVPWVLAQMQGGG